MLLASRPTFVCRDVTNGLETYSIVEMIAAGDKCTVYRVICQSGRLRNRELALKKVHGTSEHLHSGHSPAISIHQTLHHPNIVSLFSSFSSSLGHFHVLELCSAGNLQDFLNTRDSRKLTENELRGIIKSICDALTYLKKELVVHRAIRPSNIMLTGDHGIKLSGFDLSVRLHSIDPKAPFAQEPFHYTAPEALSNTSYDFAIDVWSMGCVMITCLSGTPPFQGKTISEVLREISLLRYALPNDLLGDTKSFITGILQLQPGDRTSLPQISSHRFLTSSSATVAPLYLKDPPPLAIPYKQPSKDRFQNEENLPLPKKAQYQRFPSDHPVIDSTEAPTAGRARIAFKNIVNTELRALLRNEIRTKVPNKKFHLAIPGRRIVSDPVVSSKVSKVTDSVPVSSYSNNASSPAISLPHLPTGNLAADFSPGPSRESSEHEYVPPFVTDIPSVPQTLPIGTTRPIQFTTTQLNCQTHKTTYGQVTILPSRSILVDFRESQRRKGLKGDEVLVIDPSGVQISVYSAPHLSSPCCLVEPTKQFLLPTLPSIYWKQYNDAGHLIDQIKQRTPKLVLYTTAAKCTLMANSPKGDIEIVFGGNFSPGVGKGKGHDRGNKSPFMRIRLSRHCQTIELAQHLTGVRGEEWTKTTLSSTKEPPYVSANDWSSLSQVEHEAMNHLAFFIRKCEALERLDLVEETYIPPTSCTPTVLETPGNSHSSPTLNLHPEPKTSHALSSINLVPRPKFSTLTTPRSFLDNEDDNTYQKIHHRARSTSSLETNIRSKLDGNDLPTTWFENDPNMTNGDRGIQTRFISSVGWCIRYPSNVSQGGRYRIMFLDGVALDIDVDEDWVEFKSQSGELTRHRIRECISKQKMGEKMKVFEEFVSLFDDSQQQSVS